MEWHEFEAKVVPEVQRCWPSNKGIEEQASALFDAFKAFDASAVQAAVRKHFTDDLPRFPDWKRVRALLPADTKAADPAAWTRIDEHALWTHMLRFLKWRLEGKKNPFNGKAVPDNWLDEGYIAREIIGKNPSGEERSEAMNQIAKQIDEQRVRMRLPAEDPRFEYPWAQAQRLNEVVCAGTP